MSAHPKCFPLSLRPLSVVLLVSLLGVWSAHAAESAQPGDVERPEKPSQIASAEQATPASEASATAPKAEKAAASGKKPKRAKPNADSSSGEPAASKAKVAAVVADPSQDPDFALQGEYVGPIAAANSKSQRLALQIRPTGNGGFEALQYLGGLPGERSHRPDAVTLIGKRSEGFVVLSGGPWAVFVEPDHCLIVDREGHSLGKLERISRQSPTLGAAAPKDAIVLFDGKDTSQFDKARMTDEGLLMEGATIKLVLQDFDLHLEFMLPYMPAGKDQGRGNSGIYLQNRYEVQILDSFAEEPVFNGCGSIYRFRKPDVNMCLPPLVWQTYDITFTAPRWAADGAKLKNARATVWHNGVKVHDNVELETKTGNGKPEEPTLLPTYLQNHNNPVRFRNIWVVDRGELSHASFPALLKSAGTKGKKSAERSRKAAPRKPRSGGATADTDKSAP